MGKYKDYYRTIQNISKNRNWSRHKEKSIKGQLRNLHTDLEKEEYIRKIIDSQR